MVASLELEQQVDVAAEQRVGEQVQHPEHHAAGKEGHDEGEAGCGEEADEDVTPTALVRAHAAAARGLHRTDRRGGHRAADRAHEGLERREAALGLTVVTETRPELADEVADTTRGSPGFVAGAEDRRQQDCRPENYQDQDDENRHGGVVPL